MVSMSPIGTLAIRIIGTLAILIALLAGLVAALCNIIFRRRRNDKRT